jgi:hypothetical protein
MVGERADQRRPAKVAPLTIRGEQSFEIVQNQQQARVGEDGGEGGQEILQTLQGGDLLDHREPVIP